MSNRPLKEILGFTKGYITIFKGNTYALLDWFRESDAKYRKLWGWGFASDKDLPPLPAGIEPVQLKWEDVSADGVNLNSDAEIREVVDALIYEASPSEYQGKRGERLEFVGTVVRNNKFDGYYGESTCMTFEDSDGNQYVWITTTKDLPVGETYTVRGTVKAHKTFRNVKQTHLSRCTIR